MKLDSVYFDKIRLAPQSAAPEAPVPRPCEAEGCRQAGEHRAPKGRSAEGEYYWFCLDHVRSYNKAYNYFSGMDNEAVQSFQKEAAIGHRPTWRMGIDARGAAAQPPTGRSKFGWSGRTEDPFRLFGRGFQSPPPGREPRRPVRNMERRSLHVLGLDETASPTDVKARYKLLVKRNHPDANGGDRSLEDRLREIIQAYNYLKSVGFC